MSTSGKIHISPTTGKPERCKASKKTCPLGGEHYGTVAEANQAIEAQAAVEAAGSEFGGATLTSANTDATIKAIEGFSEDKYSVTSAVENDGVETVTFGTENYPNEHTVVYGDNSVVATFNERFMSSGDNEFLSAVDSFKDAPGVAGKKQEYILRNEFGSEVLRYTTDETKADTPGWVVLDKSRPVAPIKIDKPPAHFNASRSLRSFDGRQYQDGNRYTSTHVDVKGDTTERLEGFDNNGVPHNVNGQYAVIVRDKSGRMIERKSMFHGQLHSYNGEPSHIIQLNRNTTQYQYHDRGELAGGKGAHANIVTINSRTGVTTKEWGDNTQPASGLKSIEERSKTGEFVYRYADGSKKTLKIQRGREGDNMVGTLVDQKTGLPHSEDPALPARTIRTPEGNVISERMVEGKLHCDWGPAVVETDKDGNVIREEYHIDGVKTDKLP